MNMNNLFLRGTKFVVFSVCVVMMVLGKQVQAQSPVSFQAKAGVGITSFWGKNTDGKAKFAYKVGAGMDYAFNKVWSLQPSLNFVSKGYKEKEAGIGKASMNELYLELPVMVAARLNLAKNSGLVLSAGPYVAYGVGGKTSVVVEKKIPTIVGFETVEDKYKLDTFGHINDGKMGNRRFDAGIGLGITYENRNIIIGLESQLGLVNVNDKLKEVAELTGLDDFAAKNISAFVTIGYKF
ncbi:porin family protein [uncultured Parabacteroides sp.]|uniref:porin family protein n=1 Tax=uncultured Parabacteroides sp. TaxID=512312 RepID=UPI00261D049F|nr:porin family protein [uncultured Parabacteroides sp.]